MPEAPTGSAVVIATDRLTKRFPKVTAVSELSIQVGAGEIVGFLGPNGAGKTTTIRLLLGFLRPTAGRCTIFGGSPAQQPRLRRRIGYLPGDLRVDPAMSGTELFHWFGRLRGGVNEARLKGLIDRLNLDPTRPFGALSKGNRQKVGLVQAFMHDPDVLILDEPTTGLDPLVQREFLRMLREATQRGAAVLFSTHVLPEIERIASRVAIIRAGKLVTTSSVESLLDRARHRLEFRFSGTVDHRLFDGVPGVVATEFEGQTVTVAIDGPEAPALRAAAAAPGLLRVNSAGDDLEDLFLSLYEEEPGR
ncbi:MAG TPA: ABC transporter ATP-binding protein [Candidatus Sulfotelmatobacter sp.]|nr:ABC transporter ATP-binding protein [Candidatus Sulfotelmatobacter sp.]